MNYSSKGPKYILLILLLVSFSASGQRSSMFDHTIEILFDTISETTINNFDKNKRHWIKLKISNCEDCMIEAEKSLEVVRAGKLYYKEKYNWIQKKLRLDEIETCFILPGDSINYEVTYRLNWSGVWSESYSAKKSFLINSVKNHPYNSYYLEVNGFSNKSKLQPDKIQLISYLNGKQFNPIIRNEDNRFFYEVMGDSLKVLIEAGEINFEATFNNIDTSKYGGTICFGLLDDKTLIKKIKKADKELITQQHFVDAPYLKVDVDKFKSKAHYLLLFQSCAGGSNSSGFCKYY